MDDGGEEVAVNVKFLGDPDLLPSFINNGVLMRVSVGNGGADGRFEEMRIEANVVDWCWGWSGGADDDGSRSTRWLEGVGDVDVGGLVVLLVAIGIRKVREEWEVVVVKRSKELFW